MKNNKYYKKCCELFGFDIPIIEEVVIKKETNTRKFTYKNNYLDLDKKGYDSLSFIVDDSPFTEKISRGEWENIIPYSLKRSNPIAWNNFLEKRYNFIKSSIEREKLKKSNRKVIECKSRVRSRVLTYINPFFCTLTFSDESFSKDYKRIIRETLKKINVRYCLITDVGSNGRLHYHGFLDIPFHIEKDVLQFFNYNKSGYAIFNFKPLLKLGFCTCSFLDDLESSLSYSLKYSLKDNLKHEILASRF